MADSSELTEEEKRIIVEWVERHAGGGPVCPICQSRDWAVGDDLVAPVRSSVKGALHLGGGVYPMAQLISQPCGHTLFINAVVIGIVKPKPDEEAREEKIEEAPK